MTAVFPQLSIASLFYVVALLLYVFIVRRLTAFSFVIVGVLLLDFLHVGYSIFLSSFSHDPTTKTFVFYAWYIGFAITDFLFVWALAAWCKNSGLKLDVASKVILAIYAVLGFLQIFRLIERVLVNSDLMSFIYSNGIPILNFCIAAILFSFIAFSLVNNFRSQRLL